MSKFKSLALKGAASLASFAGLISSALGYSYDYSTSGADAAFATFGVAYYIFVCCMCIIGIAMLVVWVMMLIDLLKRTDAEVPNKTMWIVILILTGGIGAIIYYFSVKKKLDAKK